MYLITNSYKTFYRNYSDAVQKQNQSSEASSAHAINTVDFNVNIAVFSAFYTIKLMCLLLCHVSYEY